LNPRISEVDRRCGNSSPDPRHTLARSRSGRRRSCSRASARPARPSPTAA